MPAPEDLKEELKNQKQAVRGPGKQSFFRVGDTVRASDRPDQPDNYGKVVSVLDGDEYRVKFVSPETGKQKVKTLSIDQLSKVEPESKKAEPLDGDDETQIRQWPKLDDRAFYGIASDVVELATRKSEADPVAVLATFICRFAIEAGSGPVLYVGDTKHYARLNAVIVGSSSKARKGTSGKPINRLFRIIREDENIYSTARCSPGPLSSGEGLIYAVHDPIKKWHTDKKTGGGSWVIDEPGVDDKRLFVLDEELAGALKATRREGNTLSVMIRSMFDSGDLEPLTKSNRIKATGAHIGIVTHITLAELHYLLEETEALNGFANRFLWICARRQGFVSLPEPMPLSSLSLLQSRIFAILAKVQGLNELQLHPGAKELWKSIYPKLSQEEPGFIGCVVNRAEALTIRLSMIYALMDASRSIERKHMEAALAMWSYAKDSAYFIFGDRETNPVAQKILDALKDGPSYLSDLHRLFSNHATRLQIQTALTELMAAERIVIVVEQTRGRPKQIISLSEKREISEKSQDEEGEEHFNSLNSLSSPMSKENENPEVRCADCHHYTFNKKPNLPGQCIGEPWDDSAIQAPQIEHECASYLARDERTIQ